MTNNKKANPIRLALEYFIGEIYYYLSFSLILADFPWRPLR